MLRPRKIQPLRNPTNSRIYPTPCVRTPKKHLFNLCPALYRLEQWLSSPVWTQQVERRGVV